MTEKANAELRKRLYDNRIAMWELGVEMGVGELTVVRWMRTPLTEDRRSRVETAFASIMQKRGANNE